MPNACTVFFAKGLERWLQENAVACKTDESKTRPQASLAGDFVRSARLGTVATPGFSADH
jgi:hypothetical protein